MQEKHLYEYAVIRVLPKVEREEFINVGVILFCKREKYLKLRYTINENKLAAFSNEIDIDFLKENLNSLDKICQGKSEGGNVALFEIPERFRWITAVKSSCLQTSRPHPGFSENLDQTLNQLFEELVL